MNSQGEGHKTDLQQLPPTVNLDGSKVRQIRESKGLTQLYVATAVGVTTDTISRWENRRYPTVKRENALKLAEILEVDITEILEAEEKPSTVDEEASQDTGTPTMPASETGEAREEKVQPGEDDQDIAPSASGRKLLISILLLLIMAAVSGGTYLYFKPHKETLEITASRFLPDHSAPGQVFPVVIDVYVKPAKQRTLLVKDGDHSGIEFLKAVPNFTSRNGQFVKWIYQGDLGYTKFIYLAKIKKGVSSGDLFIFQGQVTVKERKKHSIPIEGNNLISALPFSWADINKDHVIDDEEILEAYDLLSGIKDAEKTLHEVEVLWSAGSYRWDMKKGKFQPVRKTTEPEKALKQTGNQ